MVGHALDFPLPSAFASFKCHLKHNIHNSLPFGIASLIGRLMFRTETDLLNEAICLPDVSAVSCREPDSQGRGWNYVRLSCYETWTRPRVNNSSPKRKTWRKRNRTSKQFDRLVAKQTVKLLTSSTTH